MKAATRRRTPRRRPRGGFTLIELLLTLVLLLLLLGAVVINFTGLQTAVQLDEGAEQFESLIRYARAHAANTGCRVRVSFAQPQFAEEDGWWERPAGSKLGLGVSWEPEPLERPGEFFPLLELSPLVESLLQLVRVEDVRPLGQLSVNSNQSAVVDDGLPMTDHSLPSFAPITFYADGSSDSAEIILAARESEEERRLALRIIGTTGIVKKETVREGLLESDPAPVSK